MLLLFLRVLRELGRHAFGVDALRHVVVALVAQRADDFGGERLVQELEHHRAVGVVPGSHRALRDVLPGPLTQRLDVGEKRSAGHYVPFVSRYLLLPLAALRSDAACFALMSALARSY